MKKQGVLVLLICLSASVFAQNKMLKIRSKNYNEEGLVVDNKGNLYTGKAKEVLKTGFMKNDGVLIGEVKNGDISGVWEYHKKGDLQGYHGYLSNGDTTFSFGKKGEINWIEAYDHKESTKTEVKVDEKGDVTALHIFTYKENGDFANIFEYEKFPGNYFDVTIADYDYNSQAVVDFFRNEKGEEEIVMRDFDKHFELVRILSKNHKVQEIYLLGDILETPEDADYRLQKGFNVSFTDLTDTNNFTLSLLKGKDVIFDVVIQGGDIEMIDKRLNEESAMLIYSKEEGYLPQEHKEAEELIDVIKREVEEFLK